MTSTYIYNCKFRHSSVRSCLVVIGSSFWINSWPLTKLGSIGGHQRREKQSKQWTSFNKTALKKPNNIKFDRKWQLLCWSNVSHLGNEMAKLMGKTNRLPGVNGHRALLGWRIGPIRIWVSEKRLDLSKTKKLLHYGNALAQTYVFLLSPRALGFQLFTLLQYSADAFID